MVRVIRWKNEGSSFSPSQGWLTRAFSLVEAFCFFRMAYNVAVKDTQQMTFSACLKLITCV